MGTQMCMGHRFPFLHIGTWHCYRICALITADKQVIDFLRFGWPANRLPSAPPPTINTINHKSATMYPNEIRKQLRQLLLDGHIIGPFKSPPFLDRCGVSPLSTREKKASSARRLIVDLSYPEFASVNSHTSTVDYLGMPIDLSYPTIDDLARRVHQLGKSARMYKKDLLAAFFQIGWDPADAELFGVFYECMYFFFTVLVMGHKISPYVCQRVSSMVAYLHHRQGYFLLNYIDDFAGAEHKDRGPNSLQCSHQNCCTQLAPVRRPTKLFHPLPTWNF